MLILLVKKKILSWVGLYCCTYCSPTRIDCVGVMKHFWNVATVSQLLVYHWAGGACCRAAAQVRAGDEYNAHACYV